MNSQPTPHVLNQPYIPVNFDSDTIAAHTIIREHPFASFITVHNKQIFITQIPCLMREDGVLIAHMARANPHSAALLADQRHADDTSLHATLQFTGVNTYISPAWYGVNTGVPTWNYETVLVRGRITLIDNLPDTEAVVKGLIEAFDPQPALVKQAWADSPAAAQTAQLNAILAFEITVDTIHPKAKLSQNRSASDQQRVIAALEKGSIQDQQMAAAMRRTSP